MLDAAAKPDSAEYSTIGFSDTSVSQYSTLHTQRDAHSIIQPHPPTVDKPKNVRHSRPFVSGPSYIRMTHCKTNSLVQDITSPTIVSPPDTERKSSDTLGITWKLSNQRIWKPLDTDTNSPFQIDISKPENNLTKHTRERSTPQITHMNRRISNFANSLGVENRAFIYRSKASPFHPEKPKAISDQTSGERYDKYTPENPLESHGFKSAKNRKEIKSRNGCDIYRKNIIV